MSATFESSTNYVSAYYPTFIDVKSPVWKFQENLRIKEAKDFSTNPERAARGWIALDSIRGMLSNSDVVGELPKEFVDFMHSKVDDLDDPGETWSNKESIPYEKKHTNVRRQVKDVWMWPLTGYCPWTYITSAEGKQVLEIANEILSSELVSGAVPRLVDGKIYLTLSGFRSALWKKVDLGKIIPGLVRPLRENFETEHITLVNSDILAKLCDTEEKKEKLTNLLSKWSSTPLKFSVHSLMHTISLDWARFGICLVVGVDLASCTGLTKFMDEFNTEMSASVKIPSPHITVAIDSRC